MHKWAKEIIHFVNGGAVECWCKKDPYAAWEKLFYLTRFESADYIFRIKPKKKPSVKVAVFTDGSDKVFIANPDWEKHWTRLSDIIEIKYEEPQP